MKIHVSTVRLQEKADEYERLKEFSENIVESINVGVLAVGLNDSGGELEFAN